MVIVGVVTPLTDAFLLVVERRFVPTRAAVPEIYNGSPESVSMFGVPELVRTPDITLPVAATRAVTGFDVELVLVEPVAARDVTVARARVAVCGRAETV